MYPLSSPQPPPCKQCGKPMLQFHEDHDEDYPDYVQGQAATSRFLYRCNECGTGNVVHTPHRCVDHKCDLGEEKEIIVTSRTYLGAFICNTIFADLRCPDPHCPVHAVKMKRQEPAKV